MSFAMIACSLQDHSYLQSGTLAGVSQSGAGANGLADAEGPGGSEAGSSTAAGAGGTAGSSGGLSGLAAGAAGVAAGGTSTSTSSGGSGGTMGPVVELSRGKPASASTEQPLNYATNANDGNILTKWCASSAALPQWWRVDLGVTRVVTGLEIDLEKQGLFQYRVETSDDDNTYTTAFDNTSNLETLMSQNETLFGRGRYVRLYVTNLVSSDIYEMWACLFEIKFYGPDTPSSTGATGQAGSGG